jgi:hypothetical protein
VSALEEVKPNSTNLYLIREYMHGGLETIQSFNKFANIAWNAGIKELRWLFHIHFIFQNAMK